MSACGRENPSSLWRPVAASSSGPNACETVPSRRPCSRKRPSGSSIPYRGIGYGLLRYLHPDPELRGRLQEQPQPAISFNYLGQFDQVLGAEALFSLASESPGGDQASENRQVHQLDVAAFIVGEQLH